MARQFVSASSQLLSSSTVKVTNYAFSVAAMVNPTSIGAAQCVWGVGTSGSADNYFRFDITSTGAIRARCRTTVTPSDSTTTGLVTVGAWNLIGYRAVAADDRYAVLKNDTAALEFGARNNSAKTPSGMNRTTIGGVPDSGTAAFLNAQVAYVATWNVSLTDAEWGMLAAKVHPLLVRPQNLVELWEMRGASPEADRIGLNELTVTGSTVSATHAPIFHPSYQSMGYRTPTVVPGGGGGGARKNLLLLGVG